MESNTEKIQALAKHLNCSPEDITETQYDPDSFEAEGGEYLVLTDMEAYERAAEYIKETLWAFNPEFLAAYMPDGVDADVLKVIQEKCESANPALLKMCTDIYGLISDAIGADGRGRFMTSYDDEEWECNGFYIYRTN